MQVGIPSFQSSWLNRQSVGLTRSARPSQNVMPAASVKPAVAAVNQPTSVSVVQHRGYISATRVVMPANRASGPDRASEMSSQVRKQESSGDATRAASKEDKDSTAQKSGVVAGESPSREQKAALNSLQARDRDVRQHEAAHQAVGGRFAGAASFSFKRGSDGTLYAVGGEVPISVSAIPGEPLATIRKMRTVRAAALAPANPSAQDRSVAAQATQIMIQARANQATAARQQTADAADKPADSVEANSETSSRKQADSASAYADMARITAPMAMVVGQNAPQRVSAQA